MPAKGLQMLYTLHTAHVLTLETDRIVAAADQVISIFQRRRVAGSKRSQGA